MARIDERRKILETKLKEMSEDGVMKGKPKETLAFDPPDEDGENEPQEAKEVVPTQEKAPLLQDTNAERTKEMSHETPALSLDDYRTRYFHPVRIREKTAFTMNVETLQVLKNVLQDLGERVSMASYIDNILREHLREHKELLNNATARQRRKTTVNI
jgi:conjugative transposon protein traC